MASRIFWFLSAGAALIGGMAWQGDGIFDWGDDRSGSARTERMIEGRVERVVERSLDGMQVTDADGREIDVSPETKRDLANAVGRLVKAKADLAILRVGDASDEEIRAAEARSAQARSEVDRLRADIRRHGQAVTIEREAVREQIQQEVREDVRAAVRDVVRN